MKVPSISLPGRLAIYFPWRISRTTIPPRRNAAIGRWIICPASRKSISLCCVRAATNRWIAALPGNLRPLRRCVTGRMWIPSSMRGTPTERAKSSSASSWITPLPVKRNARAKAINACGCRIKRRKPSTRRSRR